MVFLRAWGAKGLECNNLVNGAVMGNFKGGRSRWVCLCFIFLFLMISWLLEWCGFILYNLESRISSENCTLTHTNMFIKDPNLELGCTEGGE